MAKLTFFFFTRICKSFPLSQSSGMLPHAMMSSMYCSVQDLPCVPVKSDQPMTNGGAMLPPLGY